MRVLTLIALGGLVLAPAARAQSFQSMMLVGSESVEMHGGVLAGGTPVRLRTVSEVSSRGVRAGDRIALEVAESVAWRGQVVIAAGTHASGEIAGVRQGGGLDLRLVELATASGPVRLGGDTLRAGGTIAPGTPIEAVLLDDLHFAETVRPGFALAD